MLFAKALLSLAAATAVAAADLATTKAAFTTSKIVPNVISAFDPVALLNVTYGTKQVDLGTNFTTTETSRKPTFTLIGAPADIQSATLAVFMVDPDAPTPQSPTFAQVRHYIGGGFTVAANGTLTTTTADLSAYTGPSPPTNSDAHRYVFLVYKQSATFPKTVGSNIGQFNVSAFATQYQLGAVVAGNWMTVSTKR